MRDVVAWGVLQVRTWVAFAAAFVATYLASGDGTAGWTSVVGLATLSLAALSVWAHYLDEHPEPATRRSRHERWVEDSMRRYEAKQARRDDKAAVKERGAPGKRRKAESGGHGMTKEEARVAEILRRYEEEAAARRAALKPPSGPQ